MFEKIFAMLIYVAIVAFIYFMRKRKASVQFDEMQEGVRAKGYKIAYFSTLAMLCGIIFYDVVAGAALPEYVLSSLLIIVVMVSFTIWGIYCISHDSFFGLRQNWKSYLIICIVVGSIQLISFIDHVIRLSGSETVQTQFWHLFLSQLSTNAVMAFAFYALAIAISVRLVASKKESEE